MPEAAWRSVTGREGSRAELASRFAAVRVRPAQRDDQRPEARPEEWLLSEWPEGASEPARYRLSTLPAAMGIEELVATARARWRIERDFREREHELGLGHDEGRGWRGLHHHAALCSAAYGFLVAARCRFPPGGRVERTRLHAPALPAGFRPRGAGAA